MAAAAAIVLLSGTGYAVAQFTGGGGPAASSGAAASQPQRSAAHGPAVGMEPNQSSPAASAGLAPVTFVTSGTDYRRSQFASQVRAVLARYPAGSAPAHPGGAHALPSLGLPGCVHTVTGGQRPRLVDLARYQGRPATIIVVAASGTTPAHAWVVGTGCSATQPDVLASIPLPGAG